MDEQKEYSFTGRKRIYTDERVINESNILQVLRDALITHSQNVEMIRYLLNYEAGYQPLTREKKVRSDIDIKVCDNVANQITEFKLGYNWGNPIEFVQRSNDHPIGSNKDTEDSAITLLNNMLKCEYKNTKDQELARYIEICGVGYRFIDIKRDYEEGEAVFDISILNPLFAFVVYTNDAYRKPVMACSFRTVKDGNSYYTCYTKDTRFEIINAVEIVNQEKRNNYKVINECTELNPLKAIPIIEYNRSPDRMGCFERQISDMDNLNILISDFTNDVDQNTQAIWHANDVEFPKDEDTGETKTPKSGQWVNTFTQKDGKQAFIKPLAVEYDYQGMLDNIRYRRDVIMQKCSVPLRSEPGGGSTGTAMSMSSGWSDAECSASKEALIIEQSELQSLKVILKAIQKSPDISSDSELLKLTASDIEIRFIRNKTYDMATKANAFATYLSHGIHGRDALAMVDATSNIEAVYTNSKETIEAYQKSIFEKSNNTNNENPPNSDRTLSDNSDQTGNSPILGSNVK